MLKYPAGVADTRTFRDSVTKDRTAVERMRQRESLANELCAYLETDNPSREQTADFCETLTKLLDNYPESRRIILYIPFKTLSDSPTAFRPIFWKWWKQILLKDVDSRNDYFLGKDIEHTDYEIKKCLHIFPWLLRYDVIHEWELETLVPALTKRPITGNSFFDTAPLFREQRFRCEYLQELMDETRPNVPPRKEKGVSEGYMEYRMKKAYAYVEKYHNPDVLTDYENHSARIQLQAIKECSYGVNPDKTEVLYGTHRRLESMIVTGNLLHKIAPVIWAEDLSIRTKQYDEIDGSSPYYDDRYRKFAMGMFARYVYLPPIFQG